MYQVVLVRRDTEQKECAVSEVTYSLFQALVMVAEVRSRNVYCSRAYRVAIQVYR